MVWSPSVIRLMHKCRVRPPRAVVPPHRKEKLLVLITSVLWVCLSA